MVTGKNIVDAKLLAAAPRILAENRAMVTTMLDYIKPVVVANTPLGPGHFGYHLRDSYTTDVRSNGVKTTGVLKAPMQGYWREFGTQAHFRKGLTVRESRMVVSFMGGGERAFMTAHHALSGFRRFISFYYGKAQWWRL